jgi:hypothetical protein
MVPNNNRGIIPLTDGKQVATTTAYFVGIEIIETYDLKGV